MTKLKSKKMTKSTLAIIIMGIAIVALIAFGGSFAYFTASATGNEKSVNVTTATFTLSTNADTAILTTSGQIIVPGQTIVDQAITVSAGVNANAIIVAKVAVSAESPLTAASLGYGVNTSNWEKAGVDSSGNEYYVYFVTDDNDTPEDDSDDTTNYFAAANITNVNFTTGAISLGKNVGNDSQGKTMTLSIQFALSQYNYINNGSDVATPTAASVYTAFQAYSGFGASGFNTLVVEP